VIGSLLIICGVVIIRLMEEKRPREIVNISPV